MDKRSIFQEANVAKNKMSLSTSFLQTYVHPCVINQQPHIVYPRGLKEQSPALFANLTQHYQLQGYKLKEDQRSNSSSNKYKNQRRKWAPVVLFTASLLFESSAFADIEMDIQDSTAASQKQNIELQLLANTGVREQIQSRIKQTDISINLTQLKSATAEFLYQELISRYKQKKSDPVYVSEDFKEIANYYSDFPESVRLINELKNTSWELSFDEHNWVTTGSGTMMQVDKAVIHFNTRSAAQLRLNNGCADNPVCIASPADALLHELLHAHSMLVNGEEFIAQGGMNNVLYPYKHEYAVIDAERKLYARMSTQDNIKRPQRREHTGRIVKTHCSTCIK